MQKRNTSATIFFKLLPTYLETKNIALLNQSSQHSQKTNEKKAAKAHA